ncbi:MAG: hypothetical protein SF172_00910 [Burkholderiales bacterium]|nr:hypothetical protein [Burkholderiales bacterium]
MTIRLMLSLSAAALLAACAQLSPYAGQEALGIKSLSATEIKGYLDGQGMGFAKPAELNGYPGPMHVLELADDLKLSELQRAQTAELLHMHKAEARELGRQYVDAEAALERIFASREAESSALHAALAHSADLQRRIRSSHLSTHLKQTALLAPEQIREYSRLRGYAHSHNHTH